jgi:hypothetical protein
VKPQTTRNQRLELWAKLLLKMKFFDYMHELLHMFQSLLELQRHLRMQMQMHLIEIDTHVPKRSSEV